MDHNALAVVPRAGQIQNSIPLICSRNLHRNGQTGSIAFLLLFLQPLRGLIHWAGFSVGAVLMAAGAALCRLCRNHIRRDIQGASLFVGLALGRAADAGVLLPGVPRLFRLGGVRTLIPLRRT